MENQEGISKQRYLENLNYQRLLDFVEWLIDVEYQDDNNELWNKFEKYEDKRDNS